jgi:ATP-dependent Clp protease ATP-binding subunit ClpA
VFEIFSGPARQAIMLAQDEAIGLGDDFVGTEHLLMGLAGVPGGAAGELLTEHGLSPELARVRAVEMRSADVRGGEAGLAGQRPAGQRPAGQRPGGGGSTGGGSTGAGSTGGGSTGGGSTGGGSVGQGAPAITPADALAAIGIDVAVIRQRADAAFGPGEFVYPRPAYDAPARAAIEQAVAQAEALGHDNVGTGHMLLGLLAAGDNASARILSSVGLGLPAGRPLVLARTGDRRE